MFAFSTPEPVALRIKTQAGSAHVTAADRGDTTVEVRPSNPSSDADVEHAANTIVEQRGGEIAVIAPDVRRFGRTPSIEISVALPHGSDVTAVAASADVRVRGDVGRADLTTASGNVSIEHAAEALVSVASGEVACERVDGRLAVRSASGNVRFTTAGTAEITTASGDASGRAVHGDLEVRTASGDTIIDWVDGSVSGRSASGDVRIGAVRQGTVELNSASGDLRIGVATGSAAWLDVRSISGDVNSSLDESGPPDDGAEVVSIHARTLTGDITILRAATTSNQEQR